MIKPWLTDKYRAYLKSQAWAEFREESFRHHGKHCFYRGRYVYLEENREFCTVHFGSLEVHHLTYERIFNEVLSDVRVLCQRCHRLEHLKIDAARENNRSVRRYRNGLDTYVEKKYGYGTEPAYYEGEYNDWLDRKRSWG